MRLAGFILCLSVLLSCTPREFSSSVYQDIEFDFEPLEKLETPDSAFTDISDFDYPVMYETLENGLRMFYLDINPSSERVIVLIHGEPTWGYTFRHMIPVFLEANYRVIVPDLIGFGRSDKLVKDSDYTYERHVRWLKELLFGKLHLEDLNLFVHGWGGLIGLRMVGEVPERFNTVIASNTGLPTGDEIPSESFIEWQEEVRQYDIFPVSEIIQAETNSELLPEELAAFDAPFPSEAHKSGVRTAPLLVPTSPDDVSSEPNRKAWARLKEFDKPFLTLFSSADPFSGGWARSLREKIPGAANQPHLFLSDAGHFVEEDQGKELALHIIAFIANTAH